MSPWIIHPPRRRQRELEERPVLQLPISAPEMRPEVDEDDEDEERNERGIAVIDFYI